MSASGARRIWYLLSLLGRNESGQVQCVGDECEVWYGGVDGGHGMFVLEILCKHVFLWLPISVCVSLCLSWYLGHCDLLYHLVLIVLVELSLFTFSHLVFCLVLLCRSVTRPLGRFTP